MKTHMIHRMSKLLAAGIVLALAVISTFEGYGQEKRKLAYQWPAEGTKYIQQHVIDVGDVPGHQIRLYELQRVWPDNPPSFDGVKVKEEGVRAYSDYTDLNGRSVGYYYYVLENGDKIFGRFEGASQTTVTPDGSKRSTFTGVITFTSGTGRFIGIQGTARYKAVFDPKANLNQGQIDGEYWVAK